MIFCLGLLNYLFVTPKSHKCFAFDWVAHRKTGEDQKQKSEAKAGAAFSNQKIQSWSGNTETLDL